MKNIFKTLVVAVALVATVSSVRAEEERLSVSVTADAVSRYIWRGNIGNSGDAALQPGVSASMYGVTAGYWGSMDLTDNLGGEEYVFHEHDAYVSYAKDLGEAGSIEVGYILYHFPSSGETSEIYVSYGFSAGADFGVALYYDIDEVEDFYASFSVGKEFALEGGWAASAGASIGIGGEDYNTAYYNNEFAPVTQDAGLADLNLSLGLGGPITESLSASFALNWTDLIDDDIAEGYGLMEDQFWFIAGLEYSF